MDVNEEVIIQFNIRQRQKHNSTPNSTNIFSFMAALHMAALNVIEVPLPINTYEVQNTIVSVPYQIGFQEAASVSIELIVDFHADLFTYLFAIMVFLSTMLAGTLYYFSVHNRSNDIGVFWRYYHTLTHNLPLELTWSIIPTLILCYIIAASFSLIYGLEYMGNPHISIKVIGYQWY